MTLPLPTLAVPGPVRCLNPLCRRWLRDPVSIRVGYGPDCAHERGLTPPRRVRRGRVVEAAADQLPLLDVGPLAAAIAVYDTHADSYAAVNADKGAADVARFTDLLPVGATVLDAGCGPGRDLARFAAAGLSPLGVDLSAAFAARARQHAPVVRADLRALPLQDACVDGVWASASLVHLTPAQAATGLAELARVAKPDAPLFASVKGTGVTGWRETEVGVRWYRVWTVAGIAAAVEAAGWRVLEAALSSEFVDVWARRSDNPHEGVMDPDLHKEA